MRCFGWWGGVSGIFRAWTTIGGGIACNAAFAAMDVGLSVLIRNLTGAPEPLLPRWVAAGVLAFYTALFAVAAVAAAIRRDVT